MTEVKRATIPHLGRFYAEDPGPPYILFDVYPQDRGDSPDFADAEESDVDGDGDADVVGGILKAMDGTGWGRKNCDWTIRNAGRIRGLVGLYHFLQASENPKDQADAYLWVRDQVIKAVPDIRDRLIVPIVDVERGGERSANYMATASQWVDATSKWTEVVRAATGLGVMLYGRGAMRDLYITSKMGCDRVWLPAYTGEMVLNGITYINGESKAIATTEWTRADVKLWQDYGDGSGANKRLPNAILGLGKIDMSVYVGQKPGATINGVRTYVDTQAWMDVKRDLCE